MIKYTGFTPTPNYNKRYISSPKKRFRAPGFTLIELLISLFVFAAVVTIGLSAVVVGFTSGNLTSESNKEINQNLNLIFQTINQKIIGANTYYQKVDGVPTGGKTWGFNFFNEIAFITLGHQVLVTVSDNSSSPGTPYCTYFMYNNVANDVRMLQRDCNIKNTSPSDFGTASIISADGIKITGFEVSNRHVLTQSEVRPGHPVSPYFILKITATDAKGGNETTMENAFSTPYQIVNSYSS